MEQWDREQAQLKNRMQANWVGQAGLDERANRRRYKKRFEDLQQESEMVLEMERKAALRLAEAEARAAKEEKERIEDAKDQEERLREALFKRIVEQNTAIQSLEGELRKKLMKRDQQSLIEANHLRREKKREAETELDKTNIGMPEFEIREKMQEQKRVEANLLMKSTLEKQIIEKAERDAMEGRKVEEERAAVEAVLRAMEEDESRKEMLKQSEREELQDSIRAYKKQIAHEERELKAREFKAEEEILKYQRDKEAREEELERLKTLEKAERANRTAQVAAIAGKEKEEADRMQELIIRLHQARMEQKRIEEEKAKAASREAQLSELKQGRSEQRRFKERLKREEKKRELGVELEMRRRFEAGELELQKKKQKETENKARMKSWYNGYFEAQPDPKEQKRQQWQRQRDEEQKKVALNEQVVDDARKRLFAEYAECLPREDLLSLAQTKEEENVIRALYA